MFFIQLDNGNRAIGILLAQKQFLDEGLSAI